MMRCCIDQTEDKTSMRFVLALAFVLAGITMAALSYYDTPRAKQTIHYHPRGIDALPSEASADR
jgi:hypothetical protein